MNAMRKAADFVVVGAGIVGVNAAAVLRARHPRASIVVLEKEAGLAYHASGRNSGVLHAGFYYTADSLKAKLTRAGNVWLHDYVRRKGLPLRECGKLVVAQDEGQLAGLDTLMQRGLANGVPVEEVTAEQARALEPLARTHKRALWSPSTSVSDPVAVLRAQAEDAVAAGIDIRLGSRVDGLRVVPGAGGTASHIALDVCATDAPSTGGRYTLEAGHVINAAGLYADRLAHALGVGAHMSLLPFIGLYMYTQGVPLQRLIYPVPDLQRPFLGVHFTVTVDGKVKIGPTAIPALWREQYPGDGAHAHAAAHDRGAHVISTTSPSPVPSPGPGYVDQWARCSAREMAEIVGLEARMAVASANFRALAWEEVRKYARRYMIRGAAALAHGVTNASFTRYGRPGIRAQLVDTRGMRLVMDYVVERGPEGLSTHVLNAVSPAWTCSRPFAELVVNLIIDGGGSIAAAGAAPAVP